ncbi:MAG: aminotransferase class V-fold PLP-dependent enzyme [Deltaproteobacteria bacterium]|nr:aminotransferase class V-fold PLP-dependent enzyme [Deltaproteobacteria bacterium]MBI3389271.1 aminotransferase class V-fold PLP-dependent enzyme [Deltaproteobacteria bacterium]
MKFERWRAEFPASEGLIHFNHSGRAPVPLRTTRAVSDFIAEATVVDSATYERWQARTTAVRELCARLVGATATEIAFIANTSTGLSLIASGLTWRAGDNVVAVDGDYPSNVYPWWGLRRFEVETRMVAPRNGRVTVDDIRTLVDDRTRVVTVSAVDWQTGFRCDLASIGSFCRERRVLFCVDGIQAVGALQIDVARALIDCMAVGGHKWLLAPEGCGFLFVSRRVVEQLQPSLLGWNSVVDPDNHLPYHFDLRPDATRFESGSPPHLGVHALGPSLELLHEVGAAAIEARVIDLTAQLAAGLRQRGAEIVSPWGARERSGILTFRLGSDPAGLVDRLDAQGVLCRSRAGGVRLAPHFYNNEHDIARFFAVLDAV